jgi:6-pyruvoyltetrahydropterin/6-carboxytetrahydropterin synthase
LSDEENVHLYGKCNNENGHGHNYRVEVTVTGRVDEKTGMIMNISDLKVIIQDVLKLLDHRNIDLDVEYFRNSKKASTAENIGLFIFDQIKGSLPASIDLESVRLYETEKNVVQVTRALKELEV